MKKTYKKPTADEIAEMAENGEDISQFFTNKGKKKYPVQELMLILQSKCWPSSIKLQVN